MNSTLFSQSPDRTRAWNFLSAVSIRCQVSSFSGLSNKGCSALNAPRTSALVVAIVTSSQYRSIAERERAGERKLGESFIIFHQFPLEIALCCFPPASIMSVHPASPRHRRLSEERQVLRFHRETECASTVGATAPGSRSPRHAARPARRPLQRHQQYAPSRLVPTVPALA